jgi:hypothetical protein
LLASIFYGAQAQQQQQQSEVLEDNKSKGNNNLKPVPYNDTCIYYFSFFTKDIF